MIENLRLLQHTMALLKERYTDLVNEIRRASRNGVNPRATASWDHIEASRARAEHFNALRQYGLAREIPDNPYVRDFAFKGWQVNGMSPDAQKLVNPPEEEVQDD